MPLLGFECFLKILPYLIVALLLGYHFLPLLLGQIPDLLHGHEPYLFDVVVDLLKIKRLLLDTDAV